MNPSTVVVLLMEASAHEIMARSWWSQPFGDCYELQRAAAAGFLAYLEGIHMRTMMMGALCAPLGTMAAMAFVREHLK